MNVAREDEASFTERLYGSAVAFVETAIDMVRMLTYRSDLYRSRQQLRDLSDEHLRDIGLTRRQAEAEAGRPFFDN